MENNSRGKILMIVANQGTSSVTGWPIGFWWAELTHPYHEFTSNGYRVEIASPDGGDLFADMYSDPEHESRYSAHDFISLGFKHSPLTRDLIKNTKKLSEIDTLSYDAIFFVGGQSPMVTFVDKVELQSTLAEYYETGRPTGLVCHGTCLLLKTKLSDGKLLVDGKKWTGFADSEEQFAEQAVGGKIQPFWIETEARKIDNTLFEVAPAFTPFAIADGNLIT